MMAMLMLYPSEDDCATEKSSCKRDTIYLGSTWCFEMILLLLTKIIKVYIEFFQIYFWGLCLKKIISRLCQLLIASLNQFYQSFHKFCKEVIGKKRNKKRSRSFWRNKSFFTTSIKFFLVGKLNLFSVEVGWKIDVKSLLCTRS